MPRKGNDGATPSGQDEGSFDRGSPDVADEVFIPDYVMHDFGLPEETSGATSQRGSVRRSARPSGETS